MLFLLVALIAGFLTVLAPCILPLLPVVIGGTLSGGQSKKRAYTVVASLGISIILFTLALKASTAFILVPPLFWQILSGGLLLGFGIVTLFPKLWDSIGITAALYTRANKTMSGGFMKQSFWGDVLVGAALGPVFTSCSPTYFIVLATILPAHPAEGLVYLLAYVLGLCVALFGVSIIGQNLMGKLSVVSDSRGWFKRGLGILFVLVGLAVLFGFDKKLAVSLPAGAYGITGVEQKLLELTQGMDHATTTTSSMVQAPAYTVEEKGRMFPKAPELAKADAYLNTGGQEINLAQYKGKSVVLIDFWTYSCINCQRTLPYVKSWYAKYKDQGLVVIGIHTPEFAFEHLVPNVQNALTTEGILYPVLLDNEYQTWNVFGNQYWPRKYLIDIDGYIVYDHAGEGNYDEAEHAIQAALAERAVRMSMAPIVASTTEIAPADLSGIRSPETYFGAARNEYFGNGKSGAAGVQTLVLPQILRPNTLYLGGTWNIGREYAETTADSTVGYRYSSGDVYLVASAEIPTDIEVLQDGVLVSDAAGADVKNGRVLIHESRLYKLIHNVTPGEHTFELRIKGKAVQMYTFTFG